MKRYIKASRNISAEKYNEAIRIALDELSKSKCKMAFFPFDGHNSLGGELTEYRGSESMLDDGCFVAGGVTGLRRPFFFDTYWLEKEGPQFESHIRESIDRYVNYCDDSVDKLESLAEEKVKVDEEVSDLASEIKDYFSSRYPDTKVYSTFHPYQAGSAYVLQVDFSLIGQGREPAFIIKVRIGDTSVDKLVTPDSLEDGSAREEIIREVNNKLLADPSKQKDNGKAALAYMLQQHGIDTTESEYKLSAKAYGRYEDGPRYSKKFKCMGDYLAYLSMLLHRAPTAKAISEYFGSLDTFESQILDKLHTVDDMERWAATNWWGDGDDYIFYLKNLSTDEYLYDGAED